jgi:hypothetical protein
MIIIKTKTGDHFINEKAVTEVKYDREKAVTNCHGPNGYFSHHENVVGVIYTNDAHDTEFISNGRELMALEKRIDEMRNERRLLLKHFDFMRSSYLIYREELYKIEGLIDKGKAAEDARELIKEAENKYNELLDSFSKIREKLEKGKMDFLQGKQ